MSGCWVNRLGSGLAGERLGVGIVVNTSPLLLPRFDAGGNRHTESYFITSVTCHSICCQLEAYLHWIFLTYFDTKIYI
jgi:hypothetical protein